MIQPLRENTRSEGVEVALSGGKSGRLVAASRLAGKFIAVGQSAECPLILDTHELKFTSLKKKEKEIVVAHQ